MNWQTGLGIGCVALSAATIFTATAGSQSLATAQAAAVKASPELVQSLSKEIGATPEQAAGAAGALFGLAKSRLQADEFSQISQAVPGMSELLKAAPAAGKSSNPLARASESVPAVGTAGAVAPAASAFSQLGLKPELVPKAIPVLTSFVSKSGGADAARLLTGALK
jgi:Protein of unknown function VcgC/VcgE (DUF2780)